VKALTVVPLDPDSADLTEADEPPLADGAVLVETLAIGVCGTDVEIVRGEYGEAPPGAARLILGHESLGRVLDAPPGGPVQAGDLVVGIVRRPDPVPCPSCAASEWDMCRNGLYTERGIKGLHGYASERYRTEPEFVVKVAPTLARHGVLLEPTSVVAKAWEQVMRIAGRAAAEPSTALVTGAGPIGLLAALLGVQRGLDVHVVDVVDAGPKPDLVRALGATYHAGGVAAVATQADVVIECTGVGQLVLDVMAHNAPGSIVCLTGVSSSRVLEVDIGELNRSMVLENDVVFGSVNANRRHYEAAADALARADIEWLDRLITRRLPLEKWREALHKGPDDIKVVIEFG
jgi:threonine dehydrogenase-like Zn-dependent dehydrogenase